jgi:hypothetical protein
MENLEMASTRLRRVVAELPLEKQFLALKA